MDNHDGVITHLEPDILECEVKRALESITMNKASGGDGIPVELFQILKDVYPAIPFWLAEFLLKDQLLKVWGFPCMLFVASPLLLLIFFICV